MRSLSETRALQKLQELKFKFTRDVRTGYEHRAKDCGTCDTPGACCLDAHFVNVHITLLEAKAIMTVIDRPPKEKQLEVHARVENTIPKYELSGEGDSFARTFACPLFEKGTGCLVHHEGKPLPCIAHACYENREDLPPDDLVVEREGLVGKLNELVYRKPATWLPLPVAVRRTVSPSEL